MAKPNTLYPFAKERRLTYSLTSVEGFAPPLDAGIAFFGNW